MFATDYIDRVLELTRQFRDEQHENLATAAEFSADRVVKNGALHHFDTGHMKEEPIRRAGGLLGLHHLELRVEADHILPPHRDAKLSPLAQRYFYDREDLAPLLLDKSHVREGDVLIQVSNSGKEPFTVGVGIEAQKRGVAVIALTSVAFSKELQPRHSSGKRLFEIADHVIDMGSPSGDALLEIEGIEAPVGASSGVLTAIALWSLICEISGRLAQKGLPPAIYKSVNMPDGFAFNQEMNALYRERGI